MSRSSLNYNYPLISIWIGQGLSTVGSGVYTIALSWEVIRITGSTLAMGTILLVSMLPKIIFSFLGGIAGEKYAKKNILKTVDFLRTLIGLVWGISLILREVTMTELYIFSIVFGILQAFFLPTYNSIIPEIIKRNQISRAVNINMLIFRVANLLGPAIGGVLVSLIPFSLIIIINAATYGVAFFANFLLPDIKVKLKVKQSVLESFRTGASYFYQHKVIFWSLILITFANVAVVSTSVNLPKLIQIDLSWDAKTYGWVMAMFGLGSSITLFLLSIRPLKNMQGFLYLITLFIGGSMLILISFINTPFQLMIIMFTIGASFAITSSISTIILQKETDESHRSRIFGIAGISGLLSPIGYILWGYIGDVFGNNIVFMSAGSIVILVSLFGTTTSLKYYQSEYKKIA